MLMKKINDVIDVIVKNLNWIGAIVLFCMMLLTGLDVTLRYVFNNPILGSMEITEYMMVIVVCFGIAYCAVFRDHVRVDLVTSHLPARVQNILNIIASLVFLQLYVIITWQAIMQGFEHAKHNLSSMTLYIPEAPFNFILAFGSAILCIILIKDTLNYIYKAIVE